jgi:hypothetical protein
MKISKDITVKDLHNYFSSIFPYLKLEVYRRKHEDFEGSPKKDEVSHDIKLCDLSASAEGSELIINKDMKVSEFETMMADQYGVNVQVFRKSNDIWLQTSVTDDWTLEKQNGKGERSQLNLYPEQDTEMDMD